MKEGTPIDPELYEQFLTLFTRDQLRITAWIRALVPNHTAAADVFQETSLELWRSFATFRPDTDFLPWALGVARHQVLKHWRTAKRDRLTFSEEFLHELTVEAIGLADELMPRQAALDECVKQLSDRQRDLIHRFYGDNQTAAVIASAWERSVHAVYKSLKVMRRALLECVEAKLAGQTS
ncbi:MAG: sigma-70 family RNA polymerase sigma factor [Phycisphaerales bacterium]|nr:MAG: sigma-70 family RNA polymerase sigma factor [Phycisphaerales bacterium]